MLLVIAHRNLCRLCLRRAWAILGYLYGFTGDLVSSPRWSFVVLPSIDGCNHVVREVQSRSVPLFQDPSQPSERQCCLWSLVVKAVP